MTPEQAAALRAPFPPEQIGKLPKAGMTLDYVSHAWVTDRLLQVDPGWTWRPLDTDEIPHAFRDTPGLWISLTVAGVSRIGYGEGTGPDKVKIAIGDALRNAAMRFGVALDLWEKETPEWEQVDKPKRATRVKPKQPETDQWSTPSPSGGDDGGSPPVPPPPPEAPPKWGPDTPISAAQVRLINVLAKDVGITDRLVLHDGISKLLGRPVESVKDLTRREAGLVIESLQARLPKAAS